MPPRESRLQTDRVPSLAFCIIEAANSKETLGQGGTKLGVVWVQFACPFEQLQGFVRTIQLERSDARKEVQDRVVFLFLSHRAPGKAQGLQRILAVQGVVDRLDGLEVRVAVLVVVPHRLSKPCRRRSIVAPGEGLSKNARSPGSTA